MLDVIVVVSIATTILLYGFAVDAELVVAGRSDGLILFLCYFLECEHNDSD